MLREIVTLTSNQREFTKGCGTTDAIMQYDVYSTT